MSAEAKEVKLPHLCSPIEYDDYLDKILLAMYNVGKIATAKEIVQKESSLTDYKCVGRAASFLSYLGLVEGKKSRFNLSPSGREIALALEEKKKEKALELWQQTLKTHSLFSELKKYISDQGGKRGTSIGFAEHLRKVAEIAWGTRYLREGGKRLCVLFAKKNLLTFDRENDFISFPTGAPPPTPPSTSPVTLPTLPPTPPPTPPSGGVQVTLPYTINIVVEAKDADSIKQVINLIKELTGRKGEPS